MAFSDFLNNPLPSSIYTGEENLFVEEADDKIDPADGAEDPMSPEELEVDECGNGSCSPDVNEDGDDGDDSILDPDDIDDVDGELDDFDISDLSDDELDELEDDINNSDIDDAAGDVEDVDLTPDEEREADNLMSLAATTELIRDELNATERAEFFSDVDQAQTAVLEGFLLDTDVTAELMTEAKFFNKTRVQFSKEDRKRQLFSVAVNASARAHNDRDFIKLQKIQKIRRVLKARLAKKYRSEALTRVKVYMKRLKQSKSPVLSKIGEKISK